MEEKYMCVSTIETGKVFPENKGMKNHFTGLISGTNFFSFLSLYFVGLLSERFLKTARERSKSYLFLCLFIFQRQAFVKMLENQGNDFETLFRGVSKKGRANGTIRGFRRRGFFIANWLIPQIG
jgi:hypothetical protein